ncbi:zinc ribbon domain-containing protein [Hornefia butyriciproducens]|uniref:zinc ribbon domain-containing protein n=1 Tax=Hornefia butyriciproducens TaxID=2652293 RepID=UPI003F892AA6
MAKQKNKAPTAIHPKSDRHSDHITLVGQLSIWCYTNGTCTYSDMDELIEVCVRNMVNEEFTEEQARAYLIETLPKLDYWKWYEELGDGRKFDEFKHELIEEINAFHIEGMPKLESLNALVGQYVNLEYRLE